MFGQRQGGVDKGIGRADAVDEAPGQGGFGVNLLSGKEDLLARDGTIRTARRPVSEGCGR